MAFARILGYLITDGHITIQGYGSIFLGHQIDVERILEDIKLFSTITQTNFIYKNMYYIKMPQTLMTNILNIR